MISLSHNAHGQALYSVDLTECTCMEESPTRSRHDGAVPTTTGACPPHGPHLAAIVDDALPRPRRRRRKGPSPSRWRHGKLVRLHMVRSEHVELVGTPAPFRVPPPPRPRPRGVLSHTMKAFNAQRLQHAGSAFTAPRPVSRAL
jgi:hypothetical protein